MAIRSVEQATKDLGPYFDLYLKAVSIATSHYWSHYREDAHRTRNGSRANLLCDWIGDELKKLIAGLPEIGVVDRFDVACFHFGPEWAMKVHKLDAKGFSATNDTQTCLELNDNNLRAATIPGIPEDATYVSLGYIDIPAAPEFPEVMLVCPDGDKVAWSISLGRVTPPAPIEMPREPEPEPEDGTRVVVKVPGKEENQG